MQELTMHIGELAERSELSLRTIRHYDEVGLLKPTGRTEGGFRLYTENDLERLLLIRRMKPLGFSLEQMAELLRVIGALERGQTTGGQTTRGADPSPRDTSGDEYKALAGFIADAEERRAKLAEQLAAADEFLSLLTHRAADSR